MHNVCAGKSGRLARFGEKLFDPVQIFRGGLIPVMTMGAFFMLDMMLLGLGKQTSVMTAIFRKA